MALQETDKLEELKITYMRLCHAMQSGVAASMGIDPSECMPKHLRVGVNSAMVDTGAIVKLLISKGVFTEVEFMESLVSVMQAEVDKYEADLGVKLA